MKLKLTSSCTHTLLYQEKRSNTHRGRRNFNSFKFYNKNYIRFSQVGILFFSIYNVIHLRKLSSSVVQWSKHTNLANFIHLITYACTQIVSIQINRRMVCAPCLEGSQRSYNIISICVYISRVHRLLGLSPELGQRVHFAEGTNLRCREDKKSSPTDDDDEERLATKDDASLPPILISDDDTRAEGLRGESCENNEYIVYIKWWREKG